MQAFSPVECIIWRCRSLDPIHVIPKMSQAPQFQPLNLSSLCVSRILSSSLTLSPLPSKLEAPLSRLSSLQGRWALLSRQERLVSDDGSPASLADMNKMKEEGDSVVDEEGEKFYNLLELEVLRLRPGVWKLQFSGENGPYEGLAVPW